MHLQRQVLLAARQLPVLLGAGEVVDVATVERRSVSVYEGLASTSWRSVKPIRLRTVARGAAVCLVLGELLWGLLPLALRHRPRHIIRTLPRVLKRVQVDPRRYLLLLGGSALRGLPRGHAVVRRLRA
jgi:hypothetical protein